MFGKRKREINDLREKINELNERIEWHICEGEHKWETLFFSNKVKCKKCGRTMTEEDKTLHFARRLKWAPDSITPLVNNKNAADEDEKQTEQPDSQQTCP